ncbi:MAG: hypothetical protein JNK79_02195 [Chitinophagaceae bacterium]|nr:hypothetical protein [Chitinophagaceae bacterium]
MKFAYLTNLILGIFLVFIACVSLVPAFIPKSVELNHENRIGDLITGIVFVGGVGILLLVTASKIKERIKEINKLRESNSFLNDTSK